MPSHKYKDSHQVNSGLTPSDDRQKALLEQLLWTIKLQGYNFTTVTPLTHERFLLRFNGIAKNSRDVFGWNLPFKANILPPLIFELMIDTNLLFDGGEYFRSKIRISSVGDDLFLHSHFPTDDAQAVFFGPDTYRFYRYIRQSLDLFILKSRFALPVKFKVLDVGCGSGAGGIAAIRSLPEGHPYELYLNDLNPTALLYADVCARVANVSAHLLHDDFFNISDSWFDLIVANPPYLIDSAARLYRDGGSHLGLELSVRIAKRALQLLAPNGCLILYTGVAMTSDDANPLLSELIPYLATERFKWTYDEIDPDVFGEELEQPEYKNVNRIAAVGLTVWRIN